MRVRESAWRVRNEGDIIIDVFAVYRSAISLVSYRAMDAC